MPPARLTAATTSRQWLNAKIGNSRPSSWASCVRMPRIVRSTPPNLQHVLGSGYGAARDGRGTTACATRRHPGRGDRRPQAAPARRGDRARGRGRLRRGADARRRGPRRGRARHALPALRVEGSAPARRAGASRRRRCASASISAHRAATHPPNASPTCCGARSRALERQPRVTHAMVTAMSVVRRQRRAREARDQRRRCGRSSSTRSTARR